MANNTKTAQTVDTINSSTDSKIFLENDLTDTKANLLPVDSDPALLDLTQKNYYSRVIQYVDSFGYRIDSTSLDDNFILIIGTTVESDLAVNTKFFNNGYVLLGNLDGIYKQVGDIKSGDFRCLPQYKALLSPKVQKFCATQIARLTSNKVKAEESKKANRAKRDALLAQLMA